MLSLVNEKCCLIHFLVVILSVLLILSGDIHTNPGPPMNNSNHLSLSHSNVRSLKSVGEMDHINIDLCNKFDIITISETWLKSTNDSNKFRLDGYHLPIRKDRQDNSGYGGILAWIKNCIHFKRRK